MIFLFSCSNSNTATLEDQNSKDFSPIADQPMEVKILPLKYTTFSKEILSNGKLRAYNKVDLRFRVSSEIVTSIYVKNGARVCSGQLLAKLEVFSLKNALDQSQEQLERAKLDFQDILIGQGFGGRDTTDIPSEILKAARIKSGYLKALANMEHANYNLESAKLKAPFAGVVANLFCKAGNAPSTSDKFCTIIDDSKFEVEFPVLENELLTVKKGQTASIVSYAYNDLSIMGVVEEINPIVDQNGMVKVTAVCSNTDNKLIEGMNVKVVLRDKIPEQLVIPKQALVLHSSKPVVFTLSLGHAKWNYVKTGLENTTSIVVTQGLNEGDTVIYEGNINLAHNSRVLVVNE
jgi:RND family efflux transporter MFP subunit